MRACSGVWIAHGNGSADREVVDAATMSVCRPMRPHTISGASGLSPKRRPAITTDLQTRASGRSAIRPTSVRHSGPPIGSSTWKLMNGSRMTVVEEAKTDDPVVLIQDYHLALLPKMVRGITCRMPPLSRSGTFPGRMPKAMRFVHGMSKFWKGCWAAASWDSTRAFTAVTSSTRWIGRSRRGSTGTVRPFHMGETDGGQSLSNLDRVAEPRADSPAFRRRMPQAHTGDLCAADRSPRGIGNRTSRLHEGHP